MFLGLHHRKALKLRQNAPKSEVIPHPTSQRTCEACLSKLFPLWPFLPSLRQGLGLPFVTLRGGGGRNGRLRRRLQIGRGKVWTRRTKVGWHGRRCSSWRGRGSERWRDGERGSQLAAEKEMEGKKSFCCLPTDGRRPASRGEIDKDSKHRTRTRTDAADAAFLPCFLHRR